MRRISVNYARNIKYIITYLNHYQKQEEKSQTNENVIFGNLSIK